jgi:hypothetical protein
MSAVNESIAQEYFEQLGFLVSQPCKYAASGRVKHVEEELDLLIVHPRVTEHRLPDQIIWTSSDLKTVGRAVVGVRGWHTERFSAATFAQTPEILRFAERAARSAAALRLGVDSVVAILCLPELPASGELKERTLTALKEHGIDGVLSFRTMLVELLGLVKTNRNYEKSDLLQTLRILKNYGLTKDPQMELFAKRRRGSRNVRENS